MLDPDIYGNEITTPGPREDAPARFWGPWATVGFGLVILIISMIVQVIITVIFFVAELAPMSREDLDLFDYTELLNRIDLGLMLSLSIILSAVVCLGLVYVFIKAKRGTSFRKYIGFRRISGKAVLAVLGVMIAFLVLSALVNYVLGVPEETDVMTEAYVASIWPALFWIAVILFGPLFEEVFFRGFLYEGFRNSRLGVIGAILLTSLAWALSHVQYGYFEIATIFVLGIILGIARYKTGSIWAPLIMHVFNNGLSVLLISVEFGM
jgi:membrane protease YdiL (CAAX protease family)